MSHIHHIPSPNEQYNELADWIVECWCETFPDRNPDYINVWSMIHDLADNAKSGIELRGQLAAQANANINDDFRTMRGMMAGLEGHYGDNK